MRTLGVNRSGSEYACAQGWGIFDGPSDARSVRAMRAWAINAVALPLNEACWLGINGTGGRFGGSSYRAAIAGYARRLRSRGMYVILRLSTAAPGSHVNAGDSETGNREIEMADADHAPAFWRSVATSFRRNPSVIFDLYDEPHDINWSCWRNGCQVNTHTSDSHKQQIGSYRAAGMRQLLTAVRSAGARQPVMLAGLAYAGDLSGWLSHAPRDPAGQMVASFHTFEPRPRVSDCPTTCLAQVLAVSRRVPVITDGFGEYDCDHDYSDRYMRFADRHGISYLAWTWNAWSGCANALITDYYKGTPTGFGAGLRNHLLRLRRSR